jgi:hypothetical protein
MMITISPLARHSLALRTLLLSLLSPAFAMVAHAQIGTGWNQFSPSSNIQIETGGTIHEYSGTSTSLSDGGGRYTNSGGIETFQLVSTSSNRVERRYHDEYSTGHRQFQANVMFSTPSNDECIHQVFNGTTSPYLLLREESTNGGSLKVALHSGGGQSNIGSNLYGVWFQLNSINSFNSGSHTDIYLNGSMVFTTSPNPGGTFYTKYGCYGTLGASSAKIQFKNVKMFQ